MNEKENRQESTRWRLSRVALLTRVDSILPATMISLCARLSLDILVRILGLKQA